MILAGDIGGTNSRLALYATSGNGISLQVQQDFLNHQFTSFPAVIEKFLATNAHSAIDIATLAVAGPVVGNRVTGTNLPWLVDADDIRGAANARQVVLLNDLLALAYGLHEIAASDLQTLQSGQEDVTGNCAVVAAGTGLGEAGLLRNASRFTPFPSEGGHSDFAPTDDVQTELFTYLAKRYGHVSYERVSSGAGIVNVYEFLRDSGHETEDAAMRERLEGAADKASVISHYGLTGQFSICARALEIFACVLGAEAGNVALRMFATGGVFIGGGIAPKIAPVLHTKSFRQAFADKGRMQPFMEKIPVRLILNQHTGLLGAAAYAVEQTTVAPV